MGLKGQVDTLVVDRQKAAYRAPATYTVAVGTYTIFTVTGGAILVKAFIGLITAAAVGATTIATTFNTIVGEGAAVACNGAIGTLVIVPLNAAATLVNVAAGPLTTALFHPHGMVVGLQTAAGALTPGLIAVTYAVGTSLTMSWTLVYIPLGPNAIVT